MKAWRDAGLGLQHIAVNLSSRQLRAGPLAQRVEGILSAVGLPANCLEIELTDFGTGYSSLSYLKRFPVTRLKIDRAFVRHIVTDARDAAIIKGVIALAHSVGLGVVAEGVETAEQLRVLRDGGCDEAQGHHLAPADSAAAMSTYLKVISAAI